MEWVIGYGKRGMGGAGMEKNSLHEIKIGWLRAVVVAVLFPFILIGMAMLSVAMVCAGCYVWAADSIRGAK